MVEYEALILGLGAAISKQICKLVAIGDPDFIVSRVKGYFNTNNERLTPYKEWVSNTIKLFKIFDIKVVPRNNNCIVNALMLVASNDEILDDEISKRGRYIVDTIYPPEVPYYSKPLAHF